MGLRVVSMHLTEMQSEFLDSARKFGFDLDPDCHTRTLAQALNLVCATPRSCDPCQ